MSATTPTADIGLIGLAVMMGVKQAEERPEGPAGLLSAIGIDVLIDGLVLGVAFNAGARAGLLLAVALTLEILSLGLALTASLAEFMKSRVAIVATVGALSLLLPAVVQFYPGTQPIAVGAIAAEAYG